MLLLSIECAVPPGSIALLDDELLLGEKQLDSPSRTTQQFAVAIQELLLVHDRRPSEVQLVAAHEGPGSFTGLRIGVTAAKVFAYAVGAQVLAVNTLTTIATQALTCSESRQRHGPTLSIEAILDAQRGQLFSARFDAMGDQLSEDHPTKIQDIDSWLKQLTPQTLVTGPLLKKLQDQIPDDIRIADPGLWVPRAATLGRIARAASQEGKSLRPMELNPVYYRKSAAEEKAERNG